MSNTHFKQIPGYSRYSISEDGTVISYCNKKPRIIKHVMIDGYKSVSVYSDDNKQKQIHIHRLLLLTFVGEPPETGVRMCVDHMDRDRLNNHLSNLRWVTYKENTANKS